MKKTALILFILAVTIPAMGAVNITLTQVGDTNQVVISYSCDASEEVRAFALTIDVNNSAFIVDSPESAVDPNVADYYIYPGSISFTVEDGNTVIDEFGTPIAEQDANGGVLEMASLYSENDPDPNRHDPPADSNDLAYFYVDCNGGNVTVTLSENSKRGGVVLKDPNDAFTLNLPAPLEVVCEVDCLVVGEYCGGVFITQAMYDLWVTLNKPDCWCYPCHFRGDIDGNCIIGFADVIGTDGVGGVIFDGWLDSWNIQYHPCCDIDNNGIIGFADVIGADGVGGAILDGWLDGWNTDCPVGCTPGIGECTP